MPNRANDSENATQKTTQNATDSFHPARAGWGWSPGTGGAVKRRRGGFLRALIVPGVAGLVAGAALVFTAPQLAIAIAQGCLTPGNDGPNATLTGVVNSYYPATAGAAAGATSISVNTPLAGGGPAIAAGDLLLVIQMQDADIIGTNTIAYGDGSTGAGSTNLRQTGKYEYVSAASAVVGGVVTIVGSGAGNGLVNSYDFSLTVTATNGFRTFQVIRVPQYSSATLSAGLTAAPWNGKFHAGGVLAVDVAGSLNLNAQTISVDQLGFKGALGVAQGGGVGTGTDYVRPSQGGAHGYKGEGIAGTPQFLYDAIAGAQAPSSVAADGYPSGDAARGAPGTAGGGGTDAHPSANDQNSGGGGGANGGQGGLGGNSWNTNQPVGGRGGAAFPAAVTRVILGGGGGAGTRNNSSAFASSGGTGGGIVMIRTGSLAGAGTISANGGVGVTPLNDGGGGGGAGGSVVVTTNTGTVNGLTVHANGGRGTDAWPADAGGPVDYHGPGGGGGGGVIITSPAIPLAQTAVLGGIHGTTTVDAATYGSVSGNPGVVMTTTPGAIPGSSSGAECLPVLTTTKTTSTPNVNNTVGGTTATYSITVSNAAGTGAAIGISISDALPAGFTYASTGTVALNGGATRPATVNPAAGATNPAFGTFTIPGAGSVVITFTVNIAASVAPGTYNNPATATYLDPTRTTVGGTVSAAYAGGGAERVTVHAPDLTIAKSHVDPFTRGTSGTYTVTAANSGNVPTSGTVTVTDTLPAGLTPTGAAGAGWTCPAPVGQVVTCTRADVLAGGSYPPITVTVTVLQGAASPVTNTASVSGGSETNTTNDTASDPTNIVSSADIAVAKTVDNATPNQGSNVTFTITATNNGPSNATGVQVKDLLPVGLTFVSASSGTYTPGTGVWIIGNVATGGSSTLTITATVTGTTAVTNTASKIAETEPDPVAGNNTASVIVTGQAADIAITKTVSSSTPNVGSQVTFTVTAHNSGPSTATGVKVTDLLPGSLTFVTSTPGSPTYTPGTGVWNVGTLANGASATLTITVIVTTTTPTTNTAATTAEDQTDPVAGNNSASAIVTGQAADIAITKIVSNPTPDFGSNVTFTVTAHNNGPSGATGVIVSDLLPAGLSFVSAAPSGPYNSGTGVWTVGSLANSASSTLSIVAKVNTTTPSTNTATKTAEDQPDPMSGNDSAVATVTPVAADVAVTKSVDNNTPNVGNTVTFTITATNNGPSGATGVVVNDLLPAGLLFVSASPPGAYNSATGDWTIGALATGAPQTLSIVATATGATPVTNTAFVKAEVQPDPVLGNNTASVTVTGQAADIAISKTVDNAAPNLNSNITFTLTATNNGPNNATGVRVTDMLPGGLVFFSATPSAAYNSGTGVWNIGPLTNGATTTLSIVATVNTTAPVTNTATKTSEDQTDPVGANNSASVAITPMAADIAITKTVDNSTPTLNTNVTFTVTAHNNGPSTATGIQVQDLLPAGLVFVSSTTTAGPYDQVSGFWTVGTLTNGATATLTITVKVTSLTNVTNTATKTAEVQVDPVTSNDSASAAVSCCTADIAVSKTVDNLTPNFGSNVTYTVTATNNGPADATGLQLTDQLPAGLVYSSSTVPGVTTYDSVSGVWNIGLLPKFTTATLTITAKVNTAAPITNTASKTAENEADPTALDDTSSVTITPVAADIAVTKTVDNSVPNLNSNVTFTVTATNNGPSTATGVVVSDPLPTGLVFVSASPSGPYNSSTGAWTIGTLTNGANQTLTIVAKVTGTSPVTNTATATAVQPDPVPGNNAGTATVTGQAADISVLKTVSDPTPNIGSNVTFVITAKNNGPSDATGVEVTDVLPGSLTLFTFNPTAGTYVPATGIWHIGPLANGVTQTLSIVATVNTTTPAINTAARTAGNQPDPNSANDTSSATVTGQSADIAITKSVDNPVPDFGTNVTFNLKATNNGPSTATGVQVTDVLPAGLILVSSTASGTTSYSGGVWNVGTLANGGSATLAIIAKVNTTSPVTNIATKSAEDQPDAVAGNNSANATITPTALADIAITKSVDNATPDLGTNVTFTVTAKNNGPNDASGVQVADALPAGLTIFSATPSAGTAYSAGVWTVGPLTNGASATLTIVATVNTTAPVTNTATKTAETEVDPNPGNDSASAIVTPVSADIAITKTVDNPAPSLNSKVTFTVTATNNGPSSATGVVVTDQLPSGLMYFSSLPSVGTYDPITRIWSIGGLANGTNATLTLVATATSTTTATNTATKTGEVQPDPVAGNNSASASVTGVSADITVTKTVNQTTPTLGQNVTYTLVAHNLGPSTAPGVQLHDMLPAQVTFVSYTSTQGTYDPATGTWNVGSMVNGGFQPVTLTVVVTVKASGLIVNTVTVLPGSYFDPNLSNNISSVTIDPPALPGLPNTSAPDITVDTTAVGAAPAPTQMIKGLLLAVLTVVAGLGVLSLAGVGRRRTRARFGRRRSRKSLDHSPGRVTVGLVAGLLSIAIISVSAGDLATTAPQTVAGPVPGTQLIGSTAVEVNPPPAPQAESFRTVTGPIVPSRLRIPAIGVDSWIGAVGLRTDGSMNVPDNLWTSSWLASGPRPGQPGNAVIAGHRGVGTPALFSHLETVQPGDRIYVSDAAGNQLIYVVTRVASMDLSTSTQVAVFGPTSGQNLVLITCFGRYIPSARTYDHRLVVFSRPVSV